MDPLIPNIRAVNPTDPVIAPLIERHLTLMLASSPVESVHAMKASDLAEAGVQFFVAFDHETPVAMGALKQTNDDHGELKSMHVLEERRGKGLADAVLGRLLQEAGVAGLKRVSLETGSQASFAAARAFYQRHGFVFCPPFEGYVEDPHSAFMTREV
ncbi:GNAT family N-acetyltransferase [Rhodobacteraceae bacterium]|nr:GNAT family N-acetyltransferase [Paracoccaceae bacterium]